MIFVTGQKIADEIIDYSMDLLPRVIQSNARKRFFFLSPMEARFRPLSRKLLDRPLMIKEIRDLIPDRDRAHLIPFMTTWDDRELAMRLGIPVYGADPAHVSYGTKSSGRRLFTEADVRHPGGFEGLHGPQEVVEAPLHLARLTPRAAKAVIKLNEGVSGWSCSPPTDGTCHAERAVFVASDGVEKHYVASDDVEMEGLQVFRPQDLLDLALPHDLHFDQTRLTGVVFHMLSAMPTHGFVGVTCIENTAGGAEALYEKVIEFLGDWARPFRP